MGSSALPLLLTPGSFPELFLIVSSPEVSSGELKFAVVSSALPFLLTQGFSPELCREKSSPEVSSGESKYSSL